MRYKSLGQEFERYKGQVKEFEGEVSNRHNHTNREMEDLKRKLVEYENRIQHMGMEN